MPPAKTSTKRANARTAPYPTSKPDTPSNDKENEAPNDSASPIEQLPKTKESKKTPERKSSSKTSAKDSSTKAHADLPDSYLDIDLEERKGEVPCYENVCGFCSVQCYP